MAVIHVQSPGLFTTVQDLGREGFGPIGVSPSGAADSISFRIGNRLVGNPDGAAGLEMTLVGGSFMFPDGAIVAVTGSDFAPTLDASSVKLWTSFEVKPLQTLTLGSTRSGARCYLCVRGGIEVKPFLGSFSTHVLTTLGGFEGRPLRKGDVLNIGAGDKSFRRRTLAPDAHKLLSPRKIFRVTEGPQSDWFPESSHHSFYSSVYHVTEESNRMGLRLCGPSLPRHSQPTRHSQTTMHSQTMITEGVALGAIQITDGDSPIILFVDQQTTGGYPKIANIISADMPSVGQLRPRDEIRFIKVAAETARSLLLEMQALLSSEFLIFE